MRMNPSAARTRLGLALAISAGTLAAAAPAALAAPSISVAPFSNLSADAPTALTVTGTGYTADAVDQATGLYAAVTATVDGTIYIDRADDKYLRTGFPNSLGADGRFTTTINVTRRFTDGVTEVDCAVTQCFVRTWRAHGNPDATNLLSQRPIVFADSDPNAPVVTVSQTRGLGEGATELTVSGRGFNPNTNRGLGFYAVYGPVTPTYWTQGTSDFGAFKRISAGASSTSSADNLNLDGTWSTRLTVSPIYRNRDGATFNCYLIRCGILTFASQGGQDRAFDTATTLSFVSTLTPKVEVSPTTNLARDAASIVAVRGSDFTSLAYASQTAVVDGRLVIPAGRGSARYLRLNGETPEDTMNLDGSFSTTVTVNPTFTTETGQTIDCRLIQCAISTWRHQTNPTPESLYTSAVLTFAPVPTSTPPRVDPIRLPVLPPALAPKAVVFKKAQTVGKGNVAQIGRVTSNVDATISTPKSVKVKIGKKRYSLTVSAPKSVKAGKSATVKVKLSKKALAALKGRTVKVSVSVKLTANGRSSTVKTTGKITAKKAKKAAKKG